MVQPCAAFPRHVPDVPDVAFLGARPLPFFGLLDSFCTAFGWWWRLAPKLQRARLNHWSKYFHFTKVAKCKFWFYDVSWCFMMFHDVSWCFMLLVSQIGFLWFENIWESRITTHISLTAVAIGSTRRGCHQTSKCALGWYSQSRW